MLPCGRVEVISVIGFSICVDMGVRFFCRKVERRKTPCGFDLPLVCRESGSCYVSVSHFSVCQVPSYSMKYSGGMLHTNTAYGFTIMESQGVGVGSILSASPKIMCVSSAAPACHLKRDLADSNTARILLGDWGLPVSLSCHSNTKFGTLSLVMFSDSGLGTYYRIATSVYVLPSYHRIGPRLLSCHSDHRIAFLYHVLPQLPTANDNCMCF